MTRPMTHPMTRTLFSSVLLLCLVAYPAMDTFGLSIIDDTGKTITLEKPAQRIIPLYAALGEILVSLDLGDRIVGKTNTDSASGNVPLIGTHMRPNIELVASLAPDLVIQVEGRNESEQSALALARLDIPVARFHIASFEDLFACTEKIAILTGSEIKAVKLTAAYKARLSALEMQSAAFAKRPSIFFEVRGLNLLGAGGNNIITEIIQVAGGKNCLAAHEKKLVRLNEEALISMNPDIYVFQEGSMNKKPISPKDRAQFATLRAVTAGHVYKVDESLFSRPGPASIEAAEQLFDIITQWNNSQSTAKDNLQPRPSTNPL